MPVDSFPGSEHAFAKLSTQEKQVLFFMSQQRSDAEIAKALFLGEGTIRNYMHSILTKLGLVDRTAAVGYALKHNLRGHMGYSDQS